MKYLEIVMSFVDLVVRALALAHTDPEFAADWKRFEQSLLAIGVDIPGDWSGEPTSASEQAAKQSVRTAQEVRMYGGDALNEVGGQRDGSIIHNADGSLSLNE